MENLARYVDKEEKVLMELIVSAHLLEQISQVASTGLVGSTENKGVYLELCADGSGSVCYMETDTTLFEFNDLKELLVLLLVNQLGMKNIPKSR